ncbi:MAG: carbohydrate ABC transporter permease [Clostridia bacterium]|nr:carbohydrate ABC transporter permease [Clostridia bacterium]
MMLKRFKKLTLAQKIVFTIVFIFFSLYAVSIIFPFFWAILSSLKTDDEYYETVFALPKEWLFDNYVKAFSEFKIGNATMIGMIFNSLWLTFSGTLVAVMVASATAYIIAKYPFWGTKIIYRIAIFTMIIPIVGNLPAMYKLVVEDLQFDNPIGILALYAGGFGFNFIILHGFFRSVSWSYAEAGFVDGATDWTVYWKIILPQALPAIVSIAILSCIGIWNDYMTPFLYLKQYPTLALGIYQFEIVQEHRSNVPIYYCAIIMSIVPILILFCCFQETIMENTVAGGLKG